MDAREKAAIKHINKYFGIKINSMDFFSKIYVFIDSYGNLFILGDFMFQDNKDLFEIKSGHLIIKYFTFAVQNYECLGEL